MPGGAAVARDTVLVNPMPDTDTKFLFELPELGALGEIIAQIVDGEDRRADAGEFQGYRLPLALGDSREIRCQDQMYGIVFREEQTPEEDIVCSMYRLLDSCSLPDTFRVALESETAALLDHRPVELTRGMAHFEKMPQALPEPFFIGAFHRRSGLAFAAAALTLILLGLLSLFLFSVLFFLLLPTPLLRKVIDHAVRAGVDTQDTGQRLAVLTQNGMFLLFRAVQTFGTLQRIQLPLVESFGQSG